MAVTEGNYVYSPLLSVLTSVELDADLSKEIWERAIKHSKSLSSSLERPVGVVVALHDLLANIERQITRPKIIELDIYSKIVKSMVTDGLTGLYNSVFFSGGVGKRDRKMQQIRLICFPDHLQHRQFQEVQ